VARPRLDLAHLRAALYGDRDPGADAVAIALHADDANLERVPVPGRVIAKHVERATAVRDDEIDVAVVVEVAGDQRASDRLHREPRSRLAAHFGKTPTIRALKQQPALCVRRTRAEHRGVIDDMSVDDRHVERAVVVGIEEGDAESDE